MPIRLLRAAALTLFGIACTVGAEAASSTVTLRDIDTIEIERTGSAAFIYADAKRDSVRLTTCVCDPTGRVRGFAYFIPTEPTREIFDQLRGEIASFSPSGNPSQSPPPTSGTVNYKITISDTATTRVFEAHVPVGGALSAWDSQIVAEFTRLLAILQRHMKFVQVASKATQRNPS